MAKRRSNGTKQTLRKAPDETQGKFVRLELDPRMHQDFRVKAAKEGLSMAVMAKKLVEKWVTTRKAGGK